MCLHNPSRTVRVYLQDYNFIFFFDHCSPFSCFSILVHSITWYCQSKYPTTTLKLKILLHNNSFAFLTTTKKSRFREAYIQFWSMYGSPTCVICSHVNDTLCCNAQVLVTLSWREIWWPFGWWSKYIQIVWVIKTNLSADCRGPNAWHGMLS